MWAIFQTIKRSWLKHIVTQLSALFILTATYSVALFIILSTNNIKNIFNIWGKVNEATIYLKSSTTKESLIKIEEYLTIHKLVDNYYYEGSEQAAKNFNKKFKDMASSSIETKNISQFFPAVYKIKFKGSHIYKEDKLTLEGFSATISSKFSSIKEVSYGKSWLSKYEKIVSGIESGSWFVVLIIALASLFVSSNVIKTVLFSKREEIEILEFIGAGTTWIYGPHIINICILSIIAFFSATVLNYSIYEISYGKISTMLSDVILKEIEFLSPLAIVTYFSLIILSVSVYSLFSISSLMPKNKKKTIYVDGAGL